MNNFGVVEVASERRAVAPGWAYVPDMPAGLAAAMSAASAGGAKNRKRAARSQGGGLGLADLTSRQEAKLRRELEVLQRDGGAAGGGGGRDAVIAIPAKAIKAQNKYTPNVRKILASQKTFANHLDDFNALNALHENNHGHGHGHGDGTAAGVGGVAATASHASSAAAGSSKGGGGGGGGGSGSGSSRRPTKKDAAKQKAGAAAAARRSVSVATSGADTPMPDAPPAADGQRRAEQGTSPPQQPAAAEPQQPPRSTVLLPYTGPRPPSHPLDGDPLLASRMPPLPADDELRALVAAPPLTYLEARAVWPADGTGLPGAAAPEKRYPARVFCEICGYWGRVKCTKCGTPVCALDCLELHREDCITRYGL